MRKIVLIIGGLGSGIIGFFFYCYCSGYLIFFFPQQNSAPFHQRTAHFQEKRSVRLFYMQQNEWLHEDVDLIWSSSQVDTSMRCMNAWLNFLEEEQLCNKKILLESVILSTDCKTAYLSFDKNPFGKQSNLHTKWLWVESLLKTIRENGFNIEKIYFLVQHQALIDSQLDFSNPWPVTGFLK